MKTKLLLLLSVAMLTTHFGIAQETDKEIKVKGLVTDANNVPIKGAYVYLDSVKTKKKTNKKGLFEMDFPADTKWVTVHSSEHGALSKKYSKQDEILFRFSKEVTPLSQADMAALGFEVKIRSRNSSINYSDYSTVYEVLNAKFPNVIVKGTRIQVGRGGPNNFSASKDPLILVNGQPMNDISSIPTTEIKYIRVISKGAETAEYGLRGTNGVILIELKG